MSELDVETERFVLGGVLAHGIAEQVSDNKEAAIVSVLCSAALNRRAGISLASFLGAAEKAYEIYTKVPVEDLWETMNEVGSEAHKKTEESTT